MFRGNESRASVLGSKTVPLNPVGLLRESPVELDSQRGEKEADSLTLDVLDKYQAVLPVTRQ